MLFWVNRFLSVRPFNMQHVQALSSTLRATALLLVFQEETFWISFALMWTWTHLGKMLNN